VETTVLMGLACLDAGSTAAHRAAKNDERVAFDCPISPGINREILNRYYEALCRIEAITAMLAPR
jgi:hypothetical protein